MPRRREVRSESQRLREIELVLARLVRFSASGYTFIENPDGLAAGLYVKKTSSGVLTKVAD